MSQNKSHGKHSGTLCARALVLVLVAACACICACACACVRVRVRVCEWASESEWTSELVCPRWRCRYLVVIFVLVRSQLPNTNAKDWALPKKAAKLVNRQLPNRKMPRHMRS